MGKGGIGIRERVDVGGGRGDEKMGVRVGYRSSGGRRVGRKRSDE